MLVQEILGLCILNTKTMTSVINEISTKRHVQLVDYTNYISISFDFYGITI